MPIRSQCRHAESHLLCSSDPRGHWYHPRQEYVLGAAADPVLAEGSFKAVPKGAACYAQPFAVDYDFLPPTANAILCVLNSVFIAIKNTPSAAPVLGVFGSVFVPTCLIATYDSFRPGARNIGRLATPFIFLGQLVTAGVALPLYYTLYSLTSGRITSPRAEYAWTALLSSVVGMLVPSVWMDTKGWDYESIALWQPFPAYMFALNLILPSVIRIFRPRSITAPVLLSAGLCIASSVKQHIELFKTTVPLYDAFVPAFEGLGLGQAGHALFAVDCAFVTLTMSSAVVSFRGSTVSNVILLAVAGVLAGPGAAMTAVWALNELKAADAKKAE